MYSKRVIYGLGPAYLNNSWGLWSFLLSWGPYRNGQGIGPWINEFFLANFSLPPDFQQLCSSFLCFWLGIIPLCGSCPELMVVGIATDQAWHISVVWGTHQQHLEMICSPGSLTIPGHKTPIWRNRRATLPFLASHRGVDVSSKHYGRGGLHLWRYKGKKFIGEERDLQSPTPSGSALPAYCRWHWHTPKQQPNSTGLSEGHVPPSGSS